MRLVVFGLTLSSSWGNGHATTYRALLKAFAARGHDITFFERDESWYADSRDLAEPDFCRLVLYKNFGDLTRFRKTIEQADAIIIGSFVRDGVAARQADLLRAQAGPQSASHRFLRHRHAGHDRQARARRMRLPRA